MIENVLRRAIETARIDDVVVVERYIFDELLRFSSPEWIINLLKGDLGTIVLCVYPLSLGAEDFGSLPSEKWHAISPRNALI
jgi:hypothetical protein